MAIRLPRGCNFRESTALLVKRPESRDVTLVTVTTSAQLLLDSSVSRRARQLSLSL